MSANNTNERRERDNQARIDEYVRKLVDAAPSLLDSATRDKLRLLLRGAGVSS